MSLGRQVGRSLGWQFDSSTGQQVIRDDSLQVIKIGRSTGQQVIKIGSSTCLQVIKVSRSAS